MAALKILVVDDESSILLLMARRLEKMGYDVLTAGSGQEALDALKADQAVGIVLLDQLMPQMDGMEAFKRMKVEIDPLPPVIMCTAHSSTHLAVEFMKAGGADFVHKPVDFEVFKARLDQVQETARIKGQLREAEVAQLAAEASDQQKSAFVAAVSHQLWTPLTAIGGLIQTAQRLQKKGQLGPEKLAEFMEKILRAETQLEKLVGDILQTVLLEDRVSLTFEAVAVSELVAEIERAPAIQEVIAAKGLVLKISIPKKLPLVRANRSYLRQVMSYLLDNAVKFTEQGKIEIEAWAEEKAVAIAVRDTGIGIEEADLPHIFDPFSQVDDSGVKPGAGLGLHICRRLVELMGGRIWARSEKEKGSAFFLSMPTEPA
ncbi:MAG: hybrid sensor histidine kinase/response regulator [Deltaproteobacteria bacterium]|nr:hybrid sensor histidine kinase/response regulator [Deltaproteobacteria bacterium]